MEYDVAILGAGPGGYVAALKAARLGLKTVVFEKEHFGGVCLNKGCIPTKTIIKSADVYETVQKAAEYGILASAPAVDMAAVMKRKATIVRRLSNGVEGLLKAAGVESIKSEGKLIAQGRIEAGGTTYYAKNILIATGSHPILPPIKGADSGNVLTSDDVLEMKDLPKTCAIVGGGVIGVEFAHILSSFGVKVTIVEMLDSIINMADEDIIQALLKKLRAKGVAIYTRSKAVEIQPGTLHFETPEGMKQAEAEKVILCVGRAPNTSADDLDRLGIKHERGKITTDDTMQTNIKGIYAIGDVNGKWMLAHAASREGITAIENIAGEQAKMDYRIIPQCIYTSPEIAWVGLTEKEAKAQGKEVKTSVFPMAANGKSMIEGDKDGFVKLIADAQTNEVLGAHLYCAHATDMIAEIALGMNLEICAEEIAHTIHPHPTVSESIMEAAEGILDKALHLP